MTRSRHRIAAVIAALLLTLAVPATGAWAAGGADPSPSPGESTIVKYTGISNYVEHPDEKPGTAQTTATIDCSQLPCQLVSLFGVNQDGYRYDSLGGGRHVTVIRGVANAQLPAAGDLCGTYWIGAGELTLSPGPTPGTLHLTRTTANSGPQCNGDAEWLGLTISGDLTAQSGRFCLVDGNCPTPTPTPSATPSASAASLVGPGSTTRHSSNPSFSEPGTLSTLPTAASASRPANLLWAATAAVVLVILVAFPSFLLNSASEQIADQVRERWRTFRRRPEPSESDSDAVVATGGRPVRWAGWPLAAGGVLAASLLSGFVDPSFGFNGGSVRTFLSILVSFLLDAVAGWFLLILLVRHTHPRATVSFRFAPLSLLVVLVVVLFTRFTGFQPGIVFGLVAGVAFGAVLATTDKARLALVGLGYSFGVGVVGWVGYSILATVSTHPSGGVLFLRETLSAMAIGGIAALPIALIPLRGLTGGEIFAWNRWVWGGAYGVGLFGFFVVLMPLPFSWQTVPVSLISWIVVFAGYAVGAVVLWMVAAHPWRRDSDSPKTPHVQSPDAAAGA